MIEILNSSEIVFISDLSSHNSAKILTKITNYKGVVILERAIFDRCNVKDKVGGSFDQYIFLNCTFIYCEDTPQRNKCVNCNKIQQDNT